MGGELYEKFKPQPPESYVRVNPDALRLWVKEVFTSLGLRERDASVVADVLVTADLMGISSHGVQRVKRYVDGLKAGSVNPRPNVRVAKELGATALIDADSGLGHSPALKAAHLAAEKAERLGVAVIGVFNSHHYGIAGYYSLKLAEKGLVGLSITNSTPLVAYVNTTGKYLGTNPISIAIPREDGFPVLFDAATSVVPVGKVEIFAKTGRPIPKGWLIDGEGNIFSGSAEDALKLIRKGEGALLPLGGLGEILGGHKGSGLALMVDFLAGVLTGSGWGRHVKYTVCEGKGNVGHLIAALNPEAFIGKDKFLRRVEEVIQEIRSLKKHPNADRVWIPGEKAWLTKKTREKIGVPLHKNVVEELKKVGDEVGVPFALLSR